LDKILQQQHYRLAHWRLGYEEINYRRFFDVSDLVSLRVELPQTFEASHALTLRLLREGKVTGLRVDHTDGLWNPKQYFARLQQGFSDKSCVLGTGKAESGKLALYVVAEKILLGNEALPTDWQVAGTTGYDFLNLLNGLFVHSSNRDAFERLYTELLGKKADFGTIVYASKKKILRTSMRADLHALTLLLRPITSMTRYGMDFTLRELESALAGIIAAFPVYRTYVNAEAQTPSAQDRMFILKAFETPALKHEISNPSILGLIKGLLLLDFPRDLDEAGRERCRNFVMKLQQLTGPVMAKGMEDTAFYTFNRFISLNEVGGSPAGFGIDLDAFHRSNRFRAQHWPHSLLASSTHDTKRGEDARARLNVLSEMPAEWRQAVSKWNRVNADKKIIISGRSAPDENDEYLLYQALVGAWIPEAEKGSGLVDFRKRILDFMVKAIREAKTHTSWIEPNPDYEQACQQFVESLLTPGPDNVFLDDFMLFHRRVAFFGLLNSLAQLVLKITVPGVPDFYQGTELWDFSLVDPDNRRRVDYGRRQTLLSELEENLPREPMEMTQFLRRLLKDYQSGQIKQYLVWRLLHYRNEHRGLFDEAGYEPLLARGPKRDHICAFARVSGEVVLIVAAARLVFTLTKGAERAALEPDIWQDTVLPLPRHKPGVKYRNVLTGQVIALKGDLGSLPVREALELLPVAVLQQCSPK
jgi:(1->4)-alpha-D-glucan 1-alpha-D-glucosylmutase